MFFGRELAGGQAAHVKPTGLAQGMEEGALNDLNAGRRCARPLHPVAHNMERRADHAAHERPPAVAEHLDQHALGSTHASLDQNGLGLGHGGRRAGVEGRHVTPGQPRRHASEAAPV